jgi:UDP-N-acetylmuramyl pentapeptide phosphotransferase/UDP-N-acetylglucosamine-1-phosphate transferase
VITIGFNIHLEAINFQMQALIFCLGLLILLGISDDVFLLSPRLKFVFQILISSVFILLCI